MWPRDKKRGTERTKWVAQIVHEGGRVGIPVRLLMEWFGYERRGRLVNGVIKRILDEHGIETDPDFSRQDVPLDDLVTFVAKLRTASILGMVTQEDVALVGAIVVADGPTNHRTETDQHGQYTFTGLHAGSYSVEISGFDPTNVAFSATTASVEVAVGESKVCSFEGTSVRESAISGQVSIAGTGLAGVTVSLQGMGADEGQMTDAGGQYTFQNLRASEYQVAISGFDAREYGFETMAATVRVEHGKTANVPFEGVLLRTASIVGQVSVEGEGLADVTVGLSGEGENQTTKTDNSGQYAFSDLPAGNFQVGISGYDTDDYSFETTSKNVSLALGGTATVPFAGMLLSE